ncbi:hypothetical protein JTB14_006812 [Gonioctena quinquepunctata]|nr:hypothetical protein JTB14_006812 [Gonioctena quinquepunctata]
MIWFAGDQLPKAYEDVGITPDILEDTRESDTQSEDEIEPEEEDDSTDEDDDLGPFKYYVSTKGEGGSFLCLFLMTWGTRGSEW